MGFLITSLLAFLAGFFATIVAAGPVTFLIFRDAIIGKYGKGLAMIIGAAIMETVYCILALSVVSSIFLESAKVQFFSRIVSSVIFFCIGIYMYKTDLKRDIKSGIRQLTHKERAMSFLSGFILVALNPTIIVTWSAAATALISFDLITIGTIRDIAIFSLSAGVGIIAGGISMIVLVGLFKMKFPKKAFNRVLKIIGIILMAASIYFLVRALAG